MRRLTRPWVRLAWDYVAGVVVVALLLFAVWCWAVIGHGWGL